MGSAGASRAAEKTDTARPGETHIEGKGELRSGGCRKPSETTLVSRQRHPGMYCHTTTNARLQNED